MILAFIIAIGSVLLLLVLALIGYGIYSVHAYGKAGRGAELLCKQIATGRDIEHAITQAEKSVENNPLNIQEDRYRFLYGAIFHSCECIANTRNGQVIAVDVLVNDD